MSAEVVIEPARYGMTGIGVGACDVRAEFRNDAVSYALDAPAFLPRGSVISSQHGALVYVSHTVHRP